MNDYPLETILLPQGAKEVKDEKKMEALWDDDSYIAEEKYDGSRYVSVGGRLFSRRVSDVTGFPVEKTDNVPHIVDILKMFPNLILDGEVYYEGMSSNEVTSIMGASSDKARWRQGYGEFRFQPLTKGSKTVWRMDESQEWADVPKKEAEDLLNTVKSPLKYVVFDILRDFDGTWLIDLPWNSRRAKLLSAYAEICMQLGEYVLPYIELSRVEDVNKREFYNEIMAKNGEGVILKNINAKYVPDKKPSWNWIKVKKHITVDVVIMGFKPAKKEYSGEDYDTHPYWEDSTGLVFTATGVTPTGVLEATRIAHERGSMVQPVSKFYFYGWIGAVTFGQFDPNNVVTMTDREGNETEHMQLKELGYFSGINEELRQDMTENPDKYLYECVEIGAMEKTKDGFYRHPVFGRLRPDKNPHECVLGE